MPRGCICSGCYYTIWFEITIILGIAFDNHRDFIMISLWLSNAIPRITFVNIRCDAICNMQFSSVSCDPNWKLRLKEWKFNLHPHYNLGRRQGQIAPKSCTAGHEIHPLRGTEICMHSCTSWKLAALMDPILFTVNEERSIFSNVIFTINMLLCLFVLPVHWWRCAHLYKATIHNGNILIHYGIQSTEIYWHFHCKLVAPWKSGP